MMVILYQMMVVLKLVRNKLKDSIVTNHQIIHKMAPNVGNVPKIVDYVLVQILMIANNAWMAHSKDLKETMSAIK